MKARTNDRNRKSTRQKWLLLVASSRLVRMAVFISFAGLLTLIIAVQPTSRSPHHGATSPLLHYVHSGRLVADLRTAAAMVEFILEPVPPDLPVTSPAHAG